MPKHTWSNLSKGTSSVSSIHLTPQSPLPALEPGIQSSSRCTPATKIGNNVIVIPASSENDLAFEGKLIEWISKKVHICTSWIVLV